MKIANIYTTSKFESDLYNVTDSKEKLVSGIPTLIIGWANAKNLYPNANILDWKIDDNTYWTFGKRERRNEYEKKTNKFMELAITKLDENTRYMFINLLSATNAEKREFLNKITSNSRKSALSYSDMLYITEEGNNIVYGISMRYIDYEGKDRNCLMNLIKNNSSITYVKEDECGVCSEIIAKLKNKVYLSTRIFV